MTGPPPRAHAGFTLLEVMVALAVLGFAVVALIELSSQSLRLVKTSGDYQRAVVLADRLATETQPGDEGVDRGEEDSLQWERRISIVPVPEELLPKQTIPGREPPKLFAVTIGVRWGRDQALELATLRTPTAVPAPPGTLPAGATGAPAPIAPVTRRPGAPSKAGR